MPQVGSPQDAMDRADRWLSSCKEAQDPQTRMIRDLRKSLDDVIKERDHLRREVVRLTELVSLPSTGS